MLNRSTSLITNVIPTISKRLFNSTKTTEFKNALNITDREIVTGANYAMTIGPTFGAIGGFAYGVKTNIDNYRHRPNFYKQDPSAYAKEACLSTAFSTGLGSMFGWFGASALTFPIIGVKATARACKTLLPKAKTPDSVNAFNRDVIKSFGPLGLFTLPSAIEKSVSTGENINRKTLR